jgi:hypothetical protein
MDVCLLVITRPSTSVDVCVKSAMFSRKNCHRYVRWSHESAVLIAEWPQKFHQFYFASFDSEGSIENLRWSYFRCCDSLIELINFLPRVKKFQRWVGRQKCCLHCEEVWAYHSCNCLLMYFKSINFVNMENIFLYINDH